MASNGNTAQIVAAISLGVVAVVLIFVSTDPGEPSSPTSTAPLAIATTTTNSARPSTTTSISDSTFVRLLPTVDGILYTTTSGTADNLPTRFFTWKDDEKPDVRGIAAGSGPAVEFDASGNTGAFVGASLGPEEGDLFLKRGSALWFPFHAQVQTFAWHTTEPGVLALQTNDKLCQTHVSLAGGIDCFEASGELVDYGNRGFLVRRGDKVVLLGASGTTLQDYVVADAEFAPDDRILLIDGASDNGWTFMLAGTAEEVEILSWAPKDVSGEYGFVEWSPDGLLAFLRYTDDRQARVSIYWPWGRHVSTFDLPGRFWNLRWSDNGRYLVLPGVIDEREHVVLVLDVITGEQTLFPHPTWVQDAHLVTSRCLDASPMIDGLTTYLDDRTESSLLEPKAVMSRDLNLESWLFISATVSDGPRHGDIATWALPGFNFIGEPAPLNLLVPANEVAEEIGPIDNTYAETPEEWMKYDGAAESQACLSD